MPRRCTAGAHKSYVILLPWRACFNARAENKLSQTANVTVHADQNQMAGSRAIPPSDDQTHDIVPEKMPMPRANLEARQPHKSRALRCVTACACNWLLSTTPMPRANLEAKQPH